MFFNSNSKNKYSEYSDAELLEIYSSELNQQCLAVLFNRYSHLIYLIGLKYLGNSDSAKDVTMDVYEKLIVKLRTQKIQNFKSWIYSVAKNECLMRLRKLKTEEEKNKIIKMDFMESGDFLNQEDEEIFTSNLLNEKIEELDEEQKKCIKLFYFEKKTYKEIAQLTFYSEKKVKSYLQNGKRNLKIALLKTGNKS